MVKLEARKENGNIIISEDSFEHLLSCLDNQKFVGELRVESPHTDRPCMRIDPRHVHAGHHAKQLGHTGRPATADHLGRDHKNCCRRAAHRAFLL